ncbi:MAG: hypothetical protein R3218_03020 [Christiangramia sp.]|nr:hypothetical protein [Christiangramia sp.]
MKNVLILILFSFVTNKALTQVTEYRPMISSMQIIERKELNEGKIDGSPYLEDEFTEGTLIQKGENHTNFYFRYNALKKVVEIKVKPDDEKSYTLPASSSFKYELKNYNYQYRNLQLENLGLVNSYFLVYYESDNYLFVGKPILKYVEAVSKKSGFGSSKPVRYDVEILWYLGKSNGMLTQIRLKEKDLDDFFSSDKMNKYFDQNKIKSEEDVVQMLKYYENNI